MKKLVSLVLMASLAACGGGGGGGGSSNETSGSSTSFPSYKSLAQVCANPRPNSSDKQGTLEDEKRFVRSFIYDTYLWYKDVDYADPAKYATPQAYFDVLKTFKITASGRLVDRFHWSQSTESYAAYSAGVATSYGIRWAKTSELVPRNYVVAEVESGSPAALAGVKRGDKLTSIDGMDFVNDGTSSASQIIADGLSPQAGSTHKLGFNAQAEISLSPATYDVSTVKNVKILQTANGKVGYFVFNRYIAKSEDELIAAITQLKAAKIDDLIIDVRYNGGGLLDVAAEFAYMIAGKDTTQSKTFSRFVFNDHLAWNYWVPFRAQGYFNGKDLPYLGLKRVSMLVTQNTASASEELINGLRGVDVQVDLIGDTTMGKPYGFWDWDNCGTTYFAIQFKGVNDKGWGDYADGFAPTCAAADDLSHERGDVEETMLKTALAYRASGTCPVSRGLGSMPKYRLQRPQSEEIMILSHPAKR